jgi:signal peptidase I
VDAKQTSSLSKWIKASIVVFVAYLIVRTFFFLGYEVDGESMEPTLDDGNKLVVNTMSYHIRDISRFDVIVFHMNKQEDYVKRVIGLPGDHIRYENDRLFINGKGYEEPYLQKRKALYPGQPITGDFTLQDLTDMERVPDGKLFVMGDNRLESMDSRHFGFISIDQVVGMVNLKYWPLREFTARFKEG